MVDTVESKAGYILTSIVDGTVGRLAARRISEVIRQQQAILDNIPDIVWLKDKEGRYIAANDPFGRAFGVTPGDLVGKNVFDIHPPDLAAKYEKDSREVMATGKRTYFEESITDRNGKIQFVEKIETPIFDVTGVVIGIIGIVHDITNRKEEEITLRHNSTHDVLTGLYNRSFFDEEFARLARSRMFPLSIVMADVNDLKTVNDTLGHEAGDNLIRLAARIILREFRTEDIVARVGGDEFAVLLPNTEKNVAENVVKRIKGCPEIINGLVSIAFGVASANNKDQLAEALKLSDKRMYLDKSVKNEL
jgi:diguanylate cyclase (GGDEF)-like protein/PAS domain S-box-containing protein